MSKCKTYLYGILLWIAGLGLLAHSVIPHDHHSFNAFAAVEDTCPATHEQPSHHDGCPIHCHVLNDLTTEKVATFVFTPVVHQLVAVIATDTDDYSFCLDVQPVQVFGYPNLYRDPFFVDASPLRAPPALG